MAWLERLFEEEEVLAELTSMPDDKAPESDTFPMRFYIEFWDVLRLDILATFADFHDKVAWCRRLNSRFIFPIPKKTAAIELRDFVPIAWLNAFINFGPKSSLFVTWI